MHIQYRIHIQRSVILVSKLQTGAGIGTEIVQNIWISYCSQVLAQKMVNNSQVLAQKMVNNSQVLAQKW
jgi:hypothetical protein